MPATIQLSAVPGTIEQYAGYSTRVTEIMGHEFGREAVVVANVGRIAAAVKAFGQHVLAAHPGQSFAILVGVKRGERKPRGFDAAYRCNGFGQDDFLLVVDRRPAPAEAAGTPVADPAPISPAAE